MGTKHMTAGAVKPLVDRVGRESGDYQFVREAYHNSYEAGATQVVIGPELGAMRRGVYRCQVVDNGRSMTRQELVGFINKFGGGGKSIGDQHENFGVGLKTSTLPWNAAGVIVAARRDGETHAVLLRLDRKANEYGLKEWEFEDAHGEVHVMDSLLLAKKAGATWTCVLGDPSMDIVEGTTAKDLLDAFIDDEQGTVVVLCGDTGKEDTFFARGAGGEHGNGPMTGIATYLSSRYDTMPVPVTVYEFRSKDKKLWPKSPEEFKGKMLGDARQIDWSVKARNPRGIGNFLRQGSQRGTRKPEAQGTVELKDGTKAHWFLLPEGEAYDGKGAGGVYWNPTIAIEYKGEIYSWLASSRDKFRQFGITRKAVIDRCTIILEPPENRPGVAGVYPDSSRSRLIWSGGKTMPWSPWAKMFQARMPAEIEAALTKATAALANLEDVELTDEQTKRLKALTKRIGSSWRRLPVAKDPPKRIEEVPVLEVGKHGSRDGKPNGDGPGSTGGQRKAGEGGRIRFVPDPQGVLFPTVKVPQPDKLPEVRWAEAEEFDDQRLIGHWNDVEYVVEANIGCPIVRDSIEYWTAQYPNLAAEQVVAAVHKIYGWKLRSVVAHMQTAKRRGRLSAEHLAQALSPLGLTTAVSGFLVEDQALSVEMQELDKKRRERMKRAG